MSHDALVRVQSHTNHPPRVSGVSIGKEYPGFDAKSSTQPSYTTQLLWRKCMNSGSYVDNSTIADPIV